MHRHSKKINYVIFSLIAIGVLANVKTLWIPLLIFGMVFYLYKFPPKSFRHKRSESRGFQRAKPKRKNMFHVIKGNKKDDEDPPKYH